MKPTQFQNKTSYNWLRQKLSNSKIISSLINIPAKLLYSIHILFRTGKMEYVMKKTYLGLALDEVLEELGL